MIIISFIVSFVCGNLESTIKSLFDSAKSAVELCISLTGILCMWSGFMKIAEKTGLVKYLSKFLKPVIKVLFPEIYKNEEASAYIGMNISANMLGLGNVATPIGIKAMEKMQELNDNKKVFSNSMLMFVVLNMASIQIIPATVIALRTNFGSINPTSIVLPTILSSSISVITGIIIVKIITKMK